MPQDYEVQPGDCMSSIAYENGFFWQTLWNLSSNAALEFKRKNPNVLMRGDPVHIPDLTVRNEPGATVMRHKFVIKGVPEKLRMALKDVQNRPRPNLDYTIVIDGKSHQGRTDANGELIESIPPGARSGKLIIVAPRPLPATAKGAGKSSSNPLKPRREVMSLNLGSLDPVSELSGVKGRLANLKFYRGPRDSNLDDNTKKAISAFQSRHGLPVTGTPDDATKALLQKLHGH